jgi:acyl-coenzyme A synthetase/AMP-(fatty) acid ligase
VYFEALPKTSTGKIQKHVLRARARDRAGRAGPGPGPAPGPATRPA